MVLALRSATVGQSYLLQIFCRISVGLMLALIADRLILEWDSSVVIKCKRESGHLWRQLIAFNRKHTSIVGAYFSLSVIIVRTALWIAESSLIDTGSQCVIDKWKQIWCRWIGYGCTNAQWTRMNKCNGKTRLPVVLPINRQVYCFLAVGLVYIVSDLDTSGIKNCPVSGNA